MSLPECPECGSDDVEQFIAGTKEGEITASWWVCNECDTSFEDEEDGDDE